MSQKSAFSYIMWFIYSMTVCISLFGVAGTISSRAGYSEVVGFGVSSAWLLFCGLIVFLMRMLLQRINSTEKIGRMPSLVIEVLLVVGLIVSGIVLRMNGLEQAGQDAAYFEVAKVAEGQTIPSVVHGAVYIYLQLLHLVFLIFGNKFLAGIWLQILLQMIAGAFLYLAVRKLTGAVSALIMLGFFMLSPIMIKEALSLSPKMLFLAVFAMITYVSARCMSSERSLVVCVITGVLISVVCYLDIIGIVLLLMTVTGLLLKRNRNEGSVLGRLKGAIFCVTGCVAGFIVWMLIDSLVSAKELIRVMGAWWKVYSPSGFSIPMIIDTTQDIAAILVLLLIMSVGIFSFWYNRNTEGLSIWILQALVLVFMQCFGMTTAELNGFCNLYLIFAALAGVGVAGSFVTETTSNAEEDKLEAQLEAMSQEFVMTNVLADEKEKLQKVKFIENPLPMPKKHEKRVLDFDRELVEGQDDFDIKIDEDDDFDI